MRKNILCGRDDGGITVKYTSTQRTPTCRTLNDDSLRRLLLSFIIMGSRISRALVTRLESASKQAEAQMDRSIQEEIKKRAAQSHTGFTDPTAVHTGYTRGQGPNQHPDGFMQKQFILDVQVQKENKDAFEMNEVVYIWISAALQAGKLTHSFVLLFKGFGQFSARRQSGGEPTR